MLWPSSKLEQPQTASQQLTAKLPHFQSRQNSCDINCHCHAEHPQLTYLHTEFDEKLAMAMPRHLHELLFQCLTDAGMFELPHANVHTTFATPTSCKMGLYLFVKSSKSSMSAKDRLLYSAAHAECLFT